MSNFLKLFACISFLIGYAVARPAVARNDPAIMANQLEAYQKITQKLTPEQKQLVEQSIAIIFDRNMSADEKYDELMAMPNVRKDSDEKQAKFLKAFLIKLNEAIRYYDKELLPTVSPNARKVLDSWEEMIKKPFDFMQMSKKEQEAKMLAMAEGLELNDVASIYSVFSKMMEKVQELGLVDMYQNFKTEMKQEFF